jgi:hypothetical protein
VGKEMTKPIDPGDYCDEMSGDWSEVPEWAIRRINFLEERSDGWERMRCPLMMETCPDVTDMSCFSVKHCYPYLCNGSCGKSNDMWVSDEELTMIRKYRGLE